MNKRPILINVGDNQHLLVIIEKDKLGKKPKKEWGEKNQENMKYGSRKRVARRVWSTFALDFKELKHKTKGQLVIEVELYSLGKDEVNFKQY